MQFAPKITTEQIEQLDLVTFPGNIIVIEREDQTFDCAIDYLKTQKIIGFDTETKPCFIQKAPRNKMAILQLASADKAFIFRLISLGLPQRLASILSDPNVLKIGAAVKEDILGLSKYRKFEPNGFIDLQTLAEKFGIAEKSVRKMSGIILNKRVSKSQQLSNWESSELSEAQLRYAAIDAWVCRQMYIRLMNS